MQILKTLVDHPMERFTLLDVGAGSGDMGQCVRAHYPRVRVASLDRRCFHLSRAGGPRVAADAFQLPFRHGTFDFVLCSSLLHHSPDSRATELISALRPFARRSLIILDLERRLLPYWFLPLTKWLLNRSHMTVRRTHLRGRGVPTRGTAQPGACCWSSTGIHTPAPAVVPDFACCRKEHMKTLRVIFGLLTAAATVGPVPAQTAVNEIKVTAKKYEFEPAVIKVKQGDHVRLVITALDHDHGFKLDALNIDLLLRKGEATTVEFTADKAGAYPFECSHFCGLGHKRMKGQLAVE